MNILTYASRMAIACSFSIIISSIASAARGDYDASKEFQRATAYYSESGVMYSPFAPRSSNATSNYTLVKPGNAAVLNQTNYGRRMFYSGDSLSLTLDDIQVPETYNDGDDFDLVVLLTISQDQETDHLVLWFQEDYKPGQEIQASTQLIYTADDFSGNNDVPEFRFRLINLKDRKNKEFRKSLNAVSDASSTAGALLTSGGLTSGANIFVQAAKLLVSKFNRSKVISDYTVHLFPPDTFRPHQDKLTLVQGTMFVLGKELNAPSRGYWDQTFEYDAASNYLSVQTSNTATAREYRGPQFIIGLNNDDWRIPLAVRNRTNHLYDLVTTLNRKNREEANAALKGVISGLSAWQLTEDYKERPSLRTFTDLANGLSGDSLSPTDKNFVLSQIGRAIRDVQPGCLLNSSARASSWLSQNNGNYKINPFGKVETLSGKTLVCPPEVVVADNS